MYIVTATSVLLVLLAALFINGQNFTYTNTTTTITTIITSIVNCNCTNATTPGNTTMPPRPGNTTMPPRPPNSTNNMMNGMNMTGGASPNNATVIIINANFGPLLFCWFPCLGGNGCGNSSQASSSPSTNGAVTIGGGASWWGGFNWWKNLTQATTVIRTQRRHRWRKGWLFSNW